MSTQRGNVSRTRPQKYKNVKAFKNDLHDTSQKTRQLNSIDVAHVCEKCCKILEWKIKYKKYKPVKCPKKCTKCDEKCVKHSYHIICLPCAKKLNICPKCGKDETIVEKASTSGEQFTLDTEMEHMVKSLSERKRRTFLRYMSRRCATGTANESNPKVIRDDLLAKLEMLRVGDNGSDVFNVDNESDYHDDISDDSD